MCYEDSPVDFDTQVYIVASCGDYDASASIKGIFDTIHQALRKINELKSVEYNIYTVTLNDEPDELFDKKHQVPLYPCKFKVTNKPVDSAGHFLSSTVIGEYTKEEFVLMILNIGGVITQDYGNTIIGKKERESIKKIDYFYADVIEWRLESDEELKQRQEAIQKSREEYARILEEEKKNYLSYHMGHPPQG